jgi:hypothetical protein
LRQAQRAQALLGRDVWSRVIRIENTAAESSYSPTVHALVFEFVGRLWFYCAANGTQSFSVYADQLAADKADFGPLLREIEPGFVRWKVIPGTNAPAGPLANGCFIESIAALRARLAEGRRISQPCLLSYYVDTDAGRRGHTVLVFREDGRARLFDPAEPKAERLFSPAFAADAITLATAFEGAKVAKARFVAVPLPRETPHRGLVAAR